MCEFCKRFDFSTVSAMTDKYGARIASSMGNSEFPADQQFNFCPVCGEKIKDNTVGMAWISVKEKLPEEDTRVLVHVDSDRSYTKIDTDRILDGIWVRWCTDVTHWMPLPEPPKEI